MSYDPEVGGSSPPLPKYFTVIDILVNNFHINDSINDAVSVVTSYISGKMYWTVRLRIWPGGFVNPYSLFSLMFHTIEHMCEAVYTDTSW